MNKWELWALIMFDEEMKSWDSFNLHNKVAHQKHYIWIIFSV